MMDGDLSLGDEHTIQCIDDVLQNHAPETCTILLTSITPINSIKRGKRKKRNQGSFKRGIYTAFKKWGEVKEKEGQEIFNDSDIQITGFEIYLRKSNLRFVKTF